MTAPLESPSAKPAPPIVEPSPSPSNRISTDEKVVRDSNLEPSGDDAPMPMPMPFWKEWALWLAIVSSIVCPFLDESIIATSIPAITSEFRALGDVGWYGSAYLMTMSSFQLIFGRLYSSFPAKPIFFVSLVLFEGGSLISALSSTSHVLIFGRSFSGVGAAGIYSGVMALFSLALPKHRLPIYLGAMGTLYCVCASTGPWIGGIITASAKLGWRWCFWINLPVAVPGLLVNCYLIKGTPKARRAPAAAAATEGSKDPGETETEIVGAAAGGSDSVWARLAKLDYVGMALLIPGICCLLVAIDNGGTEGWGDKLTIGSFVAAALLIPLFVLSQWWRGEDALLPPRIVTNRLVFSCCVLTSCVETCYLVVVYYMPMWFQTVQGVPASESGIRFLANSVSYCLVELLCGWIVAKTGYVQPWMLLGSILTAVGGGLLSTLKVLSDPKHWISFQVIAGMGVGAATDQPGLVVQRLLSEADAPLGFATILFCQNLGPTMALIIANSIFLGGLTSGITEVFGDELDAKVVLASGATEIRKMVAPEDVPKLLEIYNQSLTRAFIIVIVSATIGLFAILGVGTKKLPGEQTTTARDPEAKAGQPPRREGGVVRWRDRFSTC